MRYQLLGLGSKCCERDSTYGFLENISENLGLTGGTLRRFSKPAEGGQQNPT